MTNPGYLLGLDIGSSSIKASLISIEGGDRIASAQSPQEEMQIIAHQPGWAEQDPNLWWEHVVKSVKACLQKSALKPDAVLAIGVAYQMHGLVAINRELNPVYNSIIWCDSRAVEIGEKAFSDLGKHHCLQHYLNSPGNFTASKLRWLKINEPQVYGRIYKIMLPGDFIAMKLTGEVATTETGLSEGIFWDFEKKEVSKELLDYYGIESSLLPKIVHVFSKQGELSKAAASELGLAAKTPIAYRAGDQPNNAFSLNVLSPGETAATAGTSGVVYSVTEKNAFDIASRVNSFLHVNNDHRAPRNGVLLCVNGTGIQNSWLRKNMKRGNSANDYTEINELASKVAIGSDGVTVLPFGNGAERILGNKEIGGSIQGLNFNTHGQAHVLRAAQEGIVFALRFGFDILSEMGLKTKVIKAGKANMFLSPVFREAFVNTLDARLELYETDGSRGAALGAGVGAGIYSSYKEAFRGLKLIGVEEPHDSKKEGYAKAFERWRKILNNAIEII
ncbi:MAG TPA: FGGY family carbohydrate kinase [Cyclobacteriaceae bacterium]|jgi:xylulokinase|nr:FGGY family carbohydrate kinase [Cyclobacteriaceae bacterium]